MDRNGKEINTSVLKFLLPVLGVSFVGMVYIFAPERISNVVSVMTPILGAIFIAYLLDSFVRILVGKMKIKRGIAVMGVYAVLIGIVVLFLYKIIPMIVISINEVVDFAVNANSESFVTMFDNKFDYAFVQDIIDEIKVFSVEIRTFVNGALVYFSNWLLKFAGGIASKVLPIFSTFILSIYMLLEKEDLLARGKRALFAFLKMDNAKYTMEALGKGNKIFKSFLVGKILDSVVVGVITIIVFSILQVPQALLLGTIIGFSNIIPYFGPVIGAVPVVIITLFMDPAKALIAFVAILLIGQVDANFIDPKIVGKNTGVSAFWTITSVTIGGAAFGFVGVVISVPTVVLIKTLVEDSVARRLLVKDMASYELDHIKTIGATKKVKTKKK